MSRSTDIKEGRRALRRFVRSRAGFAAAESALLALLMCGIALATGRVLQRAAVTAAMNLNRELAGTAPDGSGKHGCGCDAASDK